MINTSVFQNKKAAYYTLGCKLNFSETSTFGKMLSELGVRQAEEGEQADICLINTCSVTEVADHKCRQAIHRMVRQNPGAFMVVTGCYAQLESEAVSRIDGVDLVLGSNEKADLVQFLSDAWTAKETAAEQEADTGAADGALHQYHSVRTKQIKSFAPSCSRGNRTRYFLKVQDGCDYYCTYCTIPYARGNSRNPTIASLVSQARQAAEEGGKEIVLTGVNIGDFGKTTGESFLDLVKALDGVEGIERYRISSMEPDLLSDELIDFCAQSRAFMPHFHIPLQSGSDEVLRLMHRRYDKQLFAHKIELIKNRMPDAFIGVDVMVGCRGETEECFEECLNDPEPQPFASPMWWLTRTRSSAASSCSTSVRRSASASMRSISARNRRCSSRKPHAERLCTASHAIMSVLNWRRSWQRKSMTISCCEYVSATSIMTSRR